MAGLVVGCGSEGAAPSDDGTADTSRVELLMTRTDAEGQLTMTGAYDYRRRIGATTTKIEGTGDAESDGSWEYRFFADRAYHRKVEGDSSWVVDPEDTGIGEVDEAIVPFPGFDPKQALEVILRAGDEEELGEEEIRGTSTTHYRVKLLPKRLGRELRRQLGEWGLSVVEAWADDAGRLRRLRMTERTANLTYEFFDFGVKVDVGRPPQDQVTTEGSSFVDSELCRRQKERLAKKKVHIDCLG